MKKVQSFAVAFLMLAGLASVGFAAASNPLLDSKLANLQHVHWGYSDALYCSHCGKCRVCASEGTVTPCPYCLPIPAAVYPDLNQTIDSDAILLNPAIFKK